MISCWFEYIRAKEGIWTVRTWNWFKSVTTHANIVATEMSRKFSVVV